MATIKNRRKVLRGRPVSDRELQVIELIAQGHSYMGVANELQVSESAVKFHVTNAMAKLEANHRAHMIAIAFAEGLLRVA